MNLRLIIRSDCAEGLWGQMLAHLHLHGIVSPRDGQREIDLRNLFFEKLEGNVRKFVQLANVRALDTTGVQMTFVVAEHFKAPFAVEAHQHLALEGGNPTGNIKRVHGNLPSKRLH